MDRARALFFLIGSCIEASVVSADILRKMLRSEPELLLENVFDIVSAYLSPVPALDEN